MEMVRKSEVTLVEDGWLYSTTVMSKTVRIKQVVMPQRSSYHTENSVISRPIRLPCTKRRNRKSGTSVSMEQSMSSSMNSSLLRLIGESGRGRTGLVLRFFARLLPGYGFYRSCYAPHWAQEVGDVDKGKKQRREPKGMLVRKEGKQAKHGDKVELNFPGFVRHPFRQRMDGQEDDASEDHARNNEHHHDVEERIGVTWRRDEERHMCRRCRIG